MNKQKQNLFVAVLFLSLALFSCKGTDEGYTNVIPADASVVISANLNELMSKAGYKDYQSIGKAVEDFYAETLLSTPKIVSAIMKNPEESGIDLDAPIYIFQHSDGRSTGIVLRVDNKEKVDTWLQPILAGMGNMSTSRIHLDENALLAFEQNGEQEWQQPATPDAQFNQSVGFKKMKEMEGDVRYCCNTRDLCAEYGDKAITGQSPIYTETLLVGSCNFDKESASLTTVLVAKTPEAEAGITAFKAALRPSEGKFIEYLPASTCMLASISGKGTDCLSYLSGTPFLETIFARNYGMWKNLINAVDGEVVVALTGLSEKGMSFIAYADLASGVTEKDLKETLTLYGMGDFKWGIKDRCFYLTSDEALASNVFKKASPSFCSEEYGKQVKGKPVYVLMDTEKLFNSPMLSQAAQQMEPNSQAFKFISATECELNGDHEFVVRLNLKDDKENVLKQIVKLLTN